ncbi:hypothetical protein LTR36_010855 [Oleoguttula mirabilis]|uniref:Uncharacterized protein n=1 Tax=Oleoguttula mirabilis TaxID=1507867 RepID=A0AAV9J440_9PEZI|nr:hypothetical protein LTR36_010855 [Oleoguttula mirabilis]
MHSILLKCGERPLERTIKRQVMNMIYYDKASASEIPRVSVLIGDTSANAMHYFCKDCHVDRRSIDLVGSHAKAIWLLSMPEDGQTHSALMMLEGSVIAVKPGIRAVTGFHDQAASRQGASLIDFFDALFLYHPNEPRACQNIGCMANVGFIPPDNAGGLDECYEFDTGPGNVPSTLLYNTTPTASECMTKTAKRASIIQ